ncbi:MAG: NAD(P)-dependent alcohol dehydrogenase [Salegentibacter sp.]
MKAALRYQYGSPDRIRIEEIQKPAPQDNEVLVKVHAATVNRTDCANLTAKPFIMRFVLGFFKPAKVILGTDLAGEIEAVGKNIQDFKVGDRVFGFNDTGLESQAEYTAIIPWNAALQTIPENISYQEAAASLEGAHYAYTFMQKSKLKPGQKGLINGASGAIGSALLQFMKQYDLKVAVTCGTGNIELMRSLGADEVFDYTKEDFTKKSATYDFIFDAVGKSTFDKCKPLLKKGGIYISSEPGPYIQNVFFALFSSFMSKKVIFPVPLSRTKSLSYIKELLEKQKFQPVIDRKYQLSEITDAYRFVMSGQKTGNVVIDI